MSLSKNLFLSILIALSISSLPVQAKDIILDATQFTTSHDIALLPIGANPLGYLQGLDYPGEWTEYAFSITEFGTNSLRILAQGTESVVFHLHVTLSAVGTVDVQEFDITFAGAGFG